MCCCAFRKTALVRWSPVYDGLGGVYSIATVVDDFIDRVMAAPGLNANPPVHEAHHRVPPAGFKYLATEMVCWATGGPQKYIGKSMADSHAHLNITAEEWEAFLDDFQQTLDKFRGSRGGATRTESDRQQHPGGYSCRLRTQSGSRLVFESRVFREMWVTDFACREW